MHQPGLQDGVDGFLPLGIARIDHELGAVRAAVAILLPAREGVALGSVVAQRGTDEAALTALSLGTDQPCRTLSDIGRPSATMRFSTRHFTSASTC